MKGKKTLKMLKGLSQYCSTHPSNHTALNKTIQYKICSSHSNADEDTGLLGRYTIRAGG